MMFSLRNLFLGLLVVPLLAAGVCRAQAGSPSDAVPQAAAGSHQVLVMLRMAPAHFQPEAGYASSYGDAEQRSARGRVAQQLAQRTGLVVVNEWPMPVLGVDCYVMTVPPERSLNEVAQELGRRPEVSWSEPVHTYRAQGGTRTAAPAPAPVYNDPMYPIEPAAREWRLAQLHQLATGHDVRVAVIDSMVDRRHVDLKDEVDTVENFVSDRPAPPETHGTAVAGVIAAEGGNGVGIVGIAPQAKIMGLRACWQQPTPASGGAPATLCDSLSLGKALQFAIEHHAQIINMSLSGADDRLLGRLLDVALADGAVVVAAYDRSATNGGFPADHKGVVGVIDEERVQTSGVLAAPGRDIPATVPGNRWSLVNGSSFAAAEVSGLYALLLQHDPKARGASTIVMNQGRATIDACATLLQKSGPCECDCGSPHQRTATATR